MTTGYKRFTACILCVLSLFVSACAERTQTGESEEISESEKVFKVDFSGKDIEYPHSVECVGLRALSCASDLDDLAYMIDSDIFCSFGKDAEMKYYRLSDDLADEAKEDSLAFMKKALQITPLGHNFFLSYDDLRLDENLIGVKAQMNGNYASFSSGMTGGEFLNYEFYKNSFKREEKDFFSLPLIKDNEKGYLKVDNGEQLFFAVLCGYAPYCEKGSEAMKLLSRSVDILSAVTTDSMTEKEIYKAIYQYVAQTVVYDDKTNEDTSLQNLYNKAFFLEGALNEGLAVCDGLTKEIVLLSRLMGIEAYHIGARVGSSGHAYVYVKADGEYYLSCPTYGAKTFPLKDGFMRYATHNYMLTDFDTNVKGWEYDSDALADIEEKIRGVEPYDYWGSTFVEIDGEKYSFRPSSTGDAMKILTDAVLLQRELGCAVEVELCGDVDVLRNAYFEIKKLAPETVYLSCGTFGKDVLQAYMFGVER